MFSDAFVSCPVVVAAAGAMMMYNYTLSTLSRSFRALR